MNRLQKFFTGQFSKQTLISLIAPILIGFFVGVMILSGIFYPIGYNPVYNDISYLCSPELNPTGWWIWAVGMLVTGLNLFPIIMHLRPRMRMISGKNNSLEKIGFMLFLCSSWGIFGLGIIPQFSGGIFLTFHIIHATMALGGLYLGSFCWGVILLTHLITQNKRKEAVLIHPIGFGIFTFFGWLGPLGFLITQGIRLASGGHDRYCAVEPCPWILAFSLWEWMIFLCIFVAFILLWFILPANSTSDRTVS
jgi:hypothetical protein